MESRPAGKSVGSFWHGGDDQSLVPASATDILRLTLDRHDHPDARESGSEYQFKYEHDRHTPSSRATSLELGQTWLAIQS